MRVGRQQRLAAQTGLLAHFDVGKTRDGNRIGLLRLDPADLHRAVAGRIDRNDREIGIDAMPNDAGLAPDAGALRKDHE